MPGTSATEFDSMHDTSFINPLPGHYHRPRKVRWASVLDYGGRLALPPGCDVPLGYKRPTA